MEQKIEGYCLKCRAKKEIKEPKSVTLKNGRKAISGTCDCCGTKIFRIGEGHPMSPLPF